MFSHTDVARSIEQYLQARGVSARITSHAKGGCHTVKVIIFDARPKVFEELELYLNHYRYQPLASLPLNEALEEVLPKVEYLFVVNHFTDNLRQQALDYIAKKSNLPAIEYKTIDFQASLKVSESKHDVLGDVLLKVLRGLDCHTYRFWDTVH